jgi:serine protease Do
MGELPMTETPKARRSRWIAASLVILMALGIGVGWFAGPAVSTKETLRSWSDRALSTHDAAPSVGFQDLVERVKPAVFGVRVKVAAEDQEQAPQEESPQGQVPGDQEPGSALEEWLRRFGKSPDQRQQKPNPPGLGISQGSGFFISSDGYAVTTNHVIENGKSIEITADSGKTYPAKLAASDPETDIALLKVEGGNDFPFVEMAEKAPRIGEWVIVVGNPFGLGGSVTAGILSARARNIQLGSYNDFIQIDAPVNQGNSGGPTFDIAGKVIGVNSAILSPTGGSVGIGFAIPAETVNKVVTELREKGAVTRGWVGLEIQPMTPEIADSLNLKQANGALVAKPEPESPAAKAGLLSGDVVTSVNGESLKDDRDLAMRIGNLAPGTEVQLGIIRQGQEKTLKMTLGQLPQPRNEAAADEKHGDQTKDGGTDTSGLGLALAPAQSLAPGGSGVVVTEVDPNGVAAEQGLQAGDIILEMGGNSVNSPSQVAQALRDARSQNQHHVLARVQSEDETRFVAIPVS